MDQKLVPKENIEIYCYIYRIETALREFIIESLRVVAGSRWYKKRLPGDVLEKYRKAIEFERSVKWSQLVPHHPIYYIDFPDLKKIIEREDNWQDAFKGIFSRKDILSSILAELEFIRNKIAHNRKANNVDVEIARTAYEKLSECIGGKYFDQLSARCTCAMDISEQLSELQGECKRTFHICKDCERIENVDVWESIRDKWWFDESYLGHKLEAITGYFVMIEGYFALPRSRGSGHKIESWVKSSGIEEKYASAQIEFGAILAGGGEKHGSQQAA
jgi:hypothetical protein